MGINQYPPRGAVSNIPSNTVSPTAPAAPKVGDIWIDSDNTLSVTDMNTYHNYTNGATGFRNIVINGNFDIWQRGTTTFTTNTGYTADRWWMYNDGVGTVNTDRIDVTDLPGARYGIRIGRSAGTARWSLGTNLETHITKQSLNRPLILSFWIRRGSGLTSTVNMNLTTTATEAKFGAALDGAQLTFSAGTMPTTWTQYTLALTPTNASSLGICIELAITSQAGAANAHVDLAQVQLEYGSIATPFEVRPYSMELAMCQRYAWVPAFNGTADYPRYRTHYFYTNGSEHTVPTPVPMRSTPAITLTTGAAPSRNTDYRVFAANGGAGLTMSADVGITLKGAALNMSCTRNDGNTTDASFAFGTANVMLSAEL